MSTRSLATDLRALGRRGLRAVQAAPGWLGGVLTGIQGALLSFLLVLAPAMAVVAAAPTASVTTGVDWAGAAAFSTDLWLLAHGLPATIGGVDVTLVPLGLTLFFGAAVAGIARRFAARTGGSWALAAGTYAAIVATVASLVMGADARVETLRTAAVAFAVAGAGTAVGVWRAHGLELAWLARVPVSIRVALLRAGVTGAWALALAAGLQTWWAVAGRQAIADSATALGLDAVGGVVLAVSELVYVPTLVLWSFAWLSGMGFSVGVGSLYAPDILTPGAVPDVPLLGALPSSAGGVLTWAPLAVVALAAAVRLLTSRAERDWRVEWGADALAVVCVGVAAAGLALAVSGSAGPGTMAVVGPAPMPVGLAYAALTAAGLVLGGAAAAVIAWVRGMLPSRAGRDGRSPVPAQDARRADAPERKPAPASSVRSAASRVSAPTAASAPEARVEDPPRSGATAKRSS